MMGGRFRAEEAGPVEGRTVEAGLDPTLGHEGEVPSPSFAMVQPYEDLDPPVWHVDLYRVEDPSEIEELGLDSAAALVVYLAGLAIMYGTR